MKISSGAKISKSTLKRSVKAIKEQDVLRSFSKDSSQKGVYVSLSYAPGSGKPQNTSQASTEQFILVTIHNIPRFNGEFEVIRVLPLADLYYRLEPGGKVYTHSISNGEFSTAPDFPYSHTLLRLYPTFVNYPYSSRGANFKRPWVEVDQEGRYTTLRSEFSPRKNQGLYHPRMVSEAPNAVLNGTGGYYMEDTADYAESKDWYKWVQSDSHISVTYPIIINQALLPDLGTVGLTDIQIDIEYKKFYEGPIQNPNDYINFENSNVFGFGTWDQYETGYTGVKLFGECVHFESGGQFNRIGLRTSQSRNQLNRKDPWASVNELPTYGDATHLLRPAQRQYYPGIYNGGSVARDSVESSNSLDPRSMPNTGKWPVYSKPKLILSEDGTKVEKSTIGSWWSKDPKYGRSIGYKHELQVIDSPESPQATGSWRTIIKQNENFTKSNIKSEDLQPVTQTSGAWEVDQDYLNYFFQIPTEIRIAQYSAIRSKITAKLELDGQTYYAFMYSDSVGAAPESALSYYYYGGDGFEGIGVNNL